MHSRNLGSCDPEHSRVPRDPEDRRAHSDDQLREKMLDKTLADSFPTSDPPSSIPDPSESDSLQRNNAAGIAGSMLISSCVGKRGKRSAISSRALPARLRSSADIRW